MRRKVARTTRIGKPARPEAERGTISTVMAMTVLMTRMAIPAIRPTMRAAFIPPSVAHGRGTG